MIKYIILAAIVYIAYRLFSNKPLLKSPDADTQYEKARDGDDDFVEYEEVD